MQKVITILSTMIRDKFWGELRIKIKDGRIELIIKEEQFKIE
jgi:hypothetical protein